MPETVLEEIEVENLDALPEDLRLIITTVEQGDHQWQVEQLSHSKYDDFDASFYEIEVKLPDRRVQILIDEQPDGLFIHEIELQDMVYVLDFDLPASPNSWNIEN